MLQNRSAQSHADMKYTGRRCHKTLCRGDEAESFPAFERGTIARSFSDGPDAQVHFTGLLGSTRQGDNDDARSWRPNRRPLVLTILTPFAARLEVLPEPMQLLKAQAANPRSPNPDISNLCSETLAITFPDVKNLPRRPSAPTGISHWSSAAQSWGKRGPTHRLHRSPFLGIPYRILGIKDKKELQRSLWGG